MQGSSLAQAIKALLKFYNSYSSISLTNMAPRSIDDSQNPPFTQAPPSYAPTYENAPPTHGAAQNVQRPSAEWLRNPAWIGKSDPLYIFATNSISFFKMVV
jgi:hypothetical protein